MTGESLSPWLEKAVLTAAQATWVLKVNKAKVWEWLSAKSDRQVPAYI